ncbi:NAD(P)H-hydrate dehydratase [Rhodopirellula sp. MGV]|uniref:NAD(P)H-hydrate dehydratase n=1 Tax=Rhodopirellula sp. MGV TaxID=2023130 RepID=UPI000B96B5FD|nr:NAD(P)H-hydrate dehydratase [Rhodopirellula sp. MGV]OYP35778.1 NAD(P)H-hydrate dehydratase [Rhodopirellula sp. MGV]PNY33640.1 NAD(P)H-hydrate dehydratase [Rhodopirellula baltica]
MQVPCPPPLTSVPNWPNRETDAHKGNFGKVLLVGASRGMAGSIALSSIAALTTGSGLVSTAIPDRCLETVAGFHPGIMTIPVQETPDGCFGEEASLDWESYDCVGCGPGMRTGKGAAGLVERLLRCTDKPRVFDADAINLLAKHRWLDDPALPRDQESLVLTPHPGELSRLTGVSPKDRDGQIEAAKRLSERHGLTMIVKGGPTCVVSAETYVNTTGNPGMATAGSGDVLTGIVTSLLGQGLTPFDAATLGVFLHGLAGDFAAEQRSQPAVTCLEIIAYLPNAIKAIAQSHRLS